MTPETATGDVVVIGASFGGVEALQRLVAALDPHLKAAVLVCLHVWARAESFLPHLLARAGSLPAHHPRDGDIPRQGNIYIAPPDLHLLLKTAACVWRADRKRIGTVRPWTFCSGRPRSVTARE
jgi:two-component system chemotaxis response regulator CheB